MQRLGPSQVVLLPARVHTPFCLELDESPARVAAKEQRQPQTLMPAVVQGDEVLFRGLVVEPTTVEAKL